VLGKPLAFPVSRWATLNRSVGAASDTRISSGATWLTARVRARARAPLALLAESAGAGTAAWSFSGDLWRANRLARTNKPRGYSLVSLFCGEPGEE